MHDLMHSVVPAALLDLIYSPLHSRCSPDQRRRPYAASPFTERNQGSFTMILIGRGCLAPRVHNHQDLTDCASSGPASPKRSPCRVAIEVAPDLEPSLRDELSRPRSRCGWRTGTLPIVFSHSDQTPRALPSRPRVGTPSNVWSLVAAPRLWVELYCLETRIATLTASVLSTAAICDSTLLAG